MERLCRKAARVVFLGVVLAALPVCLWAYGGEGGGGGEGTDNTFGGSAGGPPSIWEIDPDMEGATGGDVEGDTIQLDTPTEQNIKKELKEQYEALGGEEGTGKSFEEWSRTERADKVVIQVIREEELEEALGEAAGAHRTVVILEVADQAGQVAQIGLSFAAPVGLGTSVGLDASRAFADAYKKAKAEGKSTSEAIAIGLKNAGVKGVTTTITAGTLGNVAGKTWNKAKKIPFNPNKMQSTVKKGANILTTAGLKTTEFGVNAGLDEVRDKALEQSPNNQAPTPGTTSSSYGQPNLSGVQHVY